MAFGKRFRPVLTPGAALGSDGAGARPALMTERSEVTRSDRQRPASETVISARGLRISYVDFEAVRGIDPEVRRREELDTLLAQPPVYTSLAMKCIRWPRCAAIPRSARRRRSSV